MMLFESGGVDSARAFGAVCASTMLAQGLTGKAFGPKPHLQENPEDLQQLEVATQDLA